MSKNEQSSVMGQVWDFTRKQSMKCGIIVTAFSLIGYQLMIMPGPVSGSTENNEVLISQAKEDVFSMVPVSYRNSNPENTVEVKLVNIDEKDITPVKVEVQKQNEVKVAAEIPETSEGDMFENFKTECHNGIVNITWTTDGTDDGSFKLEYSEDNNTFLVLNEKPVFTAVDKNLNYYRLTLPVEKAETKYFRLRRDFTEDAFMYSEALKIACKQNPDDHPLIDVFPAGNDTYKVVVNSKIEDHFRVVMTDMQGQELIADEFTVADGVNQFTFKSGIMPRGNYNLKVSNGSTVIEKKVAIK